MKQHSYKRAEGTYRQESRGSSSGRSIHTNPLGTVLRNQTGNEEQLDSNLHYEMVYKSVSYPGQASYQDIAKMKGVLLDLIDEFRVGNSRVIIDGDRKNSYEKRLLLLEHQFDGLMKQKLIFEAPDREGGTRKLDYAVLLNEKENQIVELEKKVQNLQERLRRTSQREFELENEIVFLNNKIRAKNTVLETKQKQLNEEVAYSKMVGDVLNSVKSKVASNHELSRIILQEAGINSLDRNQIKLMSSKVTSQSRSSGSSSNQVLKLVRGLENLTQKSQYSFEDIEGFIQGWIFGLPENSQLRKKLSEGEVRLRNEERIKSYDEKFRLVSQIYKKQIDQVRRQHPDVSIAYDDKVFDILRDSSSRVSVNNSGVIEVEKIISKTVEVPVQDARTKTLIHLLASEMKKIYTKYPKLYGEIDPRLSEFFSQQIIDLIQVDEVDRLVQIVKYEPQVVKVENVYSMSSEKNRKVQFHLRILLKALLVEMQKIIGKTGVVPEIDEGVIGLIKEEIMDIVDIDDILKVYRVVPKIVQVQKVVEKIVEKIVQVPKLVPIENRVEVPVQVRKVDIVKDTVNVPVQVPKVETIVMEKLVQVPKIVEKVVQVPKIVQNVVEVVREVPKIVEVQKIVQKIVQVEKVREVKEEIVVRVPEYQEVFVEVEKIIPTQKIVEVIKPVEVFVERVQEVVKQIPKIVEVQKIKQVIVEKPVYYPAPQIEHEVLVKEVPVDRIIEKIVPIVKVQDRIVEVPKVIEKIVEVRDIVREVIEVEAIRQRPIIEEKVKVVEVTVQKPVIEKVEVEKVIDRFIEVPVVHQSIRVEKEYVKEPIVERVESIIHKEVEIEKPVILYQDRIVQVEKIINHFIQQPQIMNIVQEKVVPLETVVKEPIAVPTIVEKLVEKLVEVPKIVEVEKIVEKIVPVPRVVEKVVEVEKIVEKIVNKIVVEEKIKQIEKVIEVPAIQEKVLEVEVPRNIYIENQIPVEVQRQVMVRDEIRTQIPQVYEIEQPPKILIERKQIPKELIVEKIIPLATPETNLVYMDKQIVVPIEIEHPVEMLKEKLIPVEHIREQIVEVEKQREKIVAVNVEPDPQIIEVERYQDKILVDEKLKVVVEEKPYYETVIKEVKTFEEKVIPPVTVQVERLLRVQEMCDKIVERVVQAPKVYEVDRKVEKLVEKPKIVEIEKIVPHIINVNSYIETIAEKLIEIPVLLERVQQIDRLEQKIVQVGTTNTQIKEVDRNIERAVIEEKIKQAVDKIHVTEEILKVADKMIYKETDPVLISQDKVMQVPFIVEKIVEKIVVMPQIVEVLKYVHEIADEGVLGAAVSADIGEKQVQFKNLSGNVRTHMNKLLVHLRQLSSSRPELRTQIQLIQRFLAEFEKFVLYPKIHEVINEKVVQKVVEKPKVIPVSTGYQSEESYRLEISKSILIQKLIMELKRMKRENPDLQFQLDEDVKLIFGSELRSPSESMDPELNHLIQDYARSIQSKFNSMGGWTRDHQMMLNSFLEERFLMANLVKNANSKLKEKKVISEKRLESMRKYKYQRDEMEKAFNLLNSFLPSVLDAGRKSRLVDGETNRRVDSWVQNFNSILVGNILKGGQPTRPLDKLEDLRFSSTIREKDEQIYRLKEQIRRLMTRKDTHETQVVYKQVVKDVDVSGYQDRIRQLERTIRDLERIIRELEAKIRDLERIESSGSRVRTSRTTSHQQIQVYERQIERLKGIEILYERCLEQKRRCDEEKRRLNEIIIQLQNKLKDSRTIGSPGVDTQRLKSQSSSSSQYGVNYLDYANLQESERIRGVGEMGEGTEHVYRSTYAGTYGEGSGRQIGGNLSHSRGENTGNKYQTTSTYRVTTERRGGEGSGEGVSYRTFEQRESGIQRSSGGGSAFRGANYGESEVYGGDSEIYQTSSKEIIKRTSQKITEQKKRKFERKDK